MKPEERWKLVYDFPYEISDHGRVRRSQPGKGTKVGRLLKPTLMQIGYCMVTLSAKGKVHKKTVHDLVATAFVGPRPPGYDVNHKDGCKTNNHFSNLEYVTHIENVRHAFRIGLVRMPRGESRHNSKLTEMQVRVMVRLNHRGLVSHCDMAKVFNIDRRTAQKAATGESWAHLQVSPGRLRASRPSQGCVALA
jgi:hypothetical protein